MRSQAANLRSQKGFQSALKISVRLESVTAWLGLEAAERDSNNISDLAQSLSDSIELQKDLKGLEQMGTSSSEVD